MAKITIGGAEHDIPAYKLREIRAAAPYIDRVLSQRKSMSMHAGESSDEAAGRIIDENANALESMTAALGDTIAVIAVGIIKGRAQYPYTPAKIAAVVEEIEGDIGMDEVNSLAPVFNDILLEAGMMKARPKMPGVGTSASPSATASIESPQSLSQPGVPEAIGTE